MKFFTTNPQQADNYPSQQVKWWQGALFLAAITGISSLAAVYTSRRKQDEFYENEHLPAWAAPGWVFAPTWLLINTALVSGSVRLLNAPPFRNKRVLLGLHGLMWLDFATYGVVYFKLRSQILSHLWTLGSVWFSYTGIGLARAYDRRIMYSMVPLAAWATYASSLTWYQVLANPDPLFKTKALLHPVAAHDATAAQELVQATEAQAQTWSIAAETTL